MIIMNITKYPQSCLLLEKDNKRILIDPGSYVTAKYSADELPELEAIFLTHRHGDHVDPDFIKSILVKKNIPVYANQDTADLFGNLISQVIGPAQTIDIADFSVQVYDMPHCPMVDGSSGPPNNGYVFDGMFLHAGDSVSVQGLQVENAAVAIAGPDLSLRDAHNLIQNISAKRVIPMHYSIFSDEKPIGAIGMLEHATPGVEIVVLGNAETVTL